MPTSLRGTGATAPRLKGRYVADLFSGCGGVAKAVRRQGFQAREWERLQGENFDLTRPCVLRHIEQEASRSKIIAAMLAPPCGSFSGINRFAGRTRADPWASTFAHETPYMVESVRIGNACMRAALRLIRIFERHRVPWILEHPRTSRAWWLEAFNKLQRLPHVELLFLDQCQYGTPWKKSTALLCSRIDCQQRLTKRCAGNKRNLCSRTQQPHIVLRGADPKSGRNWTSIASPYPPPLNRSLAFALTDGARHKLAPIF